MKRLQRLTAGLLALSVLAPEAALARVSHAPRARACCRAPAGAMIEVALVDAMNTRSVRTGDSFAIRLAAPLIVDGRILLRSGARGVGVVVDSAKPGLGGKPGELVLAARYIQARRARVALQGLQMAGAGRDNSGAANALGVGGIAFAPLGFIGLAIHGGDVELKAGSVASAKLASDVVLPPLGRATRRELALAAASDAGRTDAANAGSVDVPPPPRGFGEVVFFRAKSLMGTGQWFNVREGGKVVGKLGNGAYFVQVTPPGTHAYSASLEPEFKARLKLQVDRGETYFVAGTLTKGVVLGAADLSPSSRATFEKVAKGLAAAAPTKPANNAADQPSDAPSGSGVNDSAAGLAAPRG
jgi:hypothetical protein